MAKYEGGCACGAVRYKTDAEPVMAGHCQCRKCQMLSGTGHSSFAAFPADAVEITGDITYWSYTADSGNAAERGHCPVCGSSLFGKSAGHSGMLGVNLGGLDDAAMITPNMAFFTAKAQPWDRVGETSASFPGMPPM